MAKVKTSISMDEEVFKKLTDMAINGDRTISKQITHLVKKSEGESEYQQSDKANG